MAKRKRTRASAPRRPATWFTELGRSKAEQYARIRDWSPERTRSYMRLKRVSELDYLLRTVIGEKDPITGRRSGGLRDYFSGFDASDGYDMRHPETLSAARVSSIRKYGAYLHTLQSQPYIKVSPGKRKGFKRALQERTGQYLKRHRSYVYHTDKPGVTRVTYREGVLEERQKLKPKVEIIRQYYFFRDFNGGRQPKTFASMVSLVEKKMLKAMPERYYTFWTDLHGAIGAPFPKSSLLRELQRYENQYGTHKGFAEGLLGFVFQGTQDQADSEYVNRLNRRTQRERQKTQESRMRQQRLRFVAQARKATTKTLRRCEVIGKGGRCKLPKGHRGSHRFK